MQHPRTAALAALLACALAHPARAQLAALTPPSDAVGSLRLAAAVDSIARQAMRNQSIPGLSVAIVKDGRVVLERGWGTERGKRPRAATGATAYQIASISKQFTAAAVLRLAEQGRVKLSDPVSAYVDGLPPSYHGVTLGRLLNHTAGVPNFTDFFREFRRPLAPGQLVDSLAKRPLLFEPGTSFRYSNSGYYLLGLVIERVSGESYPDFLRAQFWAPLGMGETEYCGARPHASVPAGYVRNRRGSAVPAAPWHPSVLFAAGSLCSTAGDLAKWSVALGEGRVLAPESYREMTSPAPSPDRNLRMTYGYGMMVDTTDAGPYLHHDGAVSGFRAQVAWYPAERLAIVVLMNQGLAAPEPIERDLARAVLGVAPREPRLAGPPPPPAATRAAAGSFPIPWQEP
ncbi:MAG TPA: serine hydrolase domain-containing protein [Longimicrobium sp.]|jgi:CubicO group peptidase (beta-lactamase class C family)|nr:serine hydrolase domain-containing protein [Longimicrobium sp.]